MGLFDGQVKSFAAKIVAALRHRSNELNLAGDKYRQMDPKSVMSERCHVGSLILAEVANVIAQVSELE